MNRRTRKFDALNTVQNAPESPRTRPEGQQHTSAPPETPEDRQPVILGGPDQDGMVDASALFPQLTEENRQIWRNQTALESDPEALFRRFLSERGRP